MQRLNRRLLPPLELAVAEQRVARLVVDQRPAPVGEDFDAALHRGARADLVEPALQVRVVVPGDALVFQDRSHG